MKQDVGRVASPNRLSSSTMPASGHGPSGFDPARIMQEFYLSQYYEPKAERPADNVQAAIEFALDRFVAPRLERMTQALCFYGNAWEQDADAERTPFGWTGSIGEVEPTDALLADKGAMAWAALRDSGRLPKGEDSRSEAECEASQSGDCVAGASPNPHSETPNA